MWQYDMQFARERTAMEIPRLTNMLTPSGLPVRPTDAWVIWGAFLFTDRGRHYGMNPRELFQGSMR